jgi:hypothetical protein
MRAEVDRSQTGARGSVLPLGIAASDVTARPVIDEDGDVVFHKGGYALRALAAGLTYEDLEHQSPFVMVLSR